MLLWILVVHFGQIGSGPTAAMKTLEIMEKKKSWIYITKLIGLHQNGWKKLSKTQFINQHKWGSKLTL